VTDRVIEYEFTLPDGSKRHEFVCSTNDVWRFVRMHGAITAQPVDKQKAAAR
jgi:hypothetical protein